MGVFHVLRCFQCRHFQVVQRRKDKKWKCKICGSKQSVIKVFASSDRAKECRLVVQELNMRRGELEQAERDDKARREVSRGGDDGRARPFERRGCGGGGGDGGAGAGREWDEGCTREHGSAPQTRHEGFQCYDHDDDGDEGEIGGRGSFSAAATGFPPANSHVQSSYGCFERASNTRTNAAAMVPASGHQKSRWGHVEDDEVSSDEGDERCGDNIARDKGIVYSLDADKLLGKKKRRRKRKRPAPQQSHQRGESASTRPPPLLQRRREQQQIMPPPQKQRCQPAGTLSRWGCDEDGTSSGSEEDDDGGNDNVIVAVAHQRPGASRFVPA